MIDAIKLAATLGNIGSVHIVNQHFGPDLLADKSLPFAIFVMGVAGRTIIIIEVIGNIDHMSEIIAGETGTLTMQNEEHFVLDPMTAHGHDTVLLSIGIAANELPHDRTHGMIDQREIKIPRTRMIWFKQFQHNTPCALIPTLSFVSQRVNAIMGSLCERL